MPFDPAVREQVYLRCGLAGPTGAGKTRGALEIATALVEAHGGKIAVVDSQKQQAKLEAGRFTFDHMDLTDKSPEGFVGAIREAVEGGYRVVVVDTGTHEWKSVLTDADRFGNWQQVRPRHNDFVAAITDSPIHIIVTFRAKMQYEVSEYEDGGRTRQRVTKLGLGPITDSELPYEFDVFAMLEVEEHTGEWSNRCDDLVGQVMTCKDAAPIIVRWLEEGDKMPWRAPTTLPEVVNRLGAFVDDAQPWIKEAVLVANDDLTEWPENFMKLPDAVRSRARSQLGETVRFLEALEGFQPKDDKATQKIVRDAFTAGFGVKVTGPEPFAAPIPFG